MACGVFDLEQLNLEPLASRVTQGEISYTAFMVEIWKESSLALWDHTWA